MNKLALTLFLICPLSLFAQTRSVGVDSTGKLAAPSNFFATNQPAKNTIYVDPNGSDTDGSKLNKRSFLTPNAAMSNAVAGDTVYLNPGVYDIGTNCIIVKHGTRLIGAGIDSTIIYSSADSRTNGCIIVPGSTSYVARLTIAANPTLKSGASRFIIAVGTTGDLTGPTPFNSQNFTNALFESVKFLGGSDAMLVRPTAVTSARFKDCIFESLFDGVVIYDDNAGSFLQHDYKFENCSFNINSAITGFSPIQNYGIRFDYGNLVLDKVTIDIIGSPGAGVANTYGLYFNGDDISGSFTGTVNNCYIRSRGTNLANAKAVFSSTGAGQANVKVNNTFIDRGSSNALGSIDAMGINWGNAAFDPNNKIQPDALGNLYVAAGTGNSNAVVKGLLFSTTSAFTNLNAVPGTLTNLAKYTNGANTLARDQDRIIAYWGGRDAGSLANTNNFRIVYGSQTILDTGLQVSSNFTFKAYVEITRTGATAQHAEAKFEWFANTGVTGLPWASTNVNVELVQTNSVATHLALMGSAQRVGAHTNNSFRVYFEPASR